MAIRIKFKYTIIAILLIAAAVFAVCFTPTHKALAEDTAVGCALSQVKTESDGVTYYCFDDPVSVYADGDGVLIAAKSGMYSIGNNAESGEKEILHKDTPADKVRRIKNEGETEYIIVLDEGRIGTLIDNNITWLDTDGTITDFCVAGNKLYAVSGNKLTIAPLLSDGINEAGVVTMPLTSSRHSTVKASKITAANGRLYISVKAVFGNKWDVCTTEIATLAGSTTCKLDTVINQSNEILSLTSSAKNGSVYLLTRSDIEGYDTTATGGLRKAYTSDGGDVTDIFAFGDQVYIMDALNALHVMSKDLSESDVIAASASSAEGFFNIPFGIAAKSSTLYIADTGNNRIAAYNKNGIRYINREFRSPVSVAADSAGTLYVAYDDNKVGIFHGNMFSEAAEIMITSTALGRIRQIAVDSEKTLFILTDTGLWRVGRDYIPHRINTVAYKAITLSVGKSRLYALTDDKVVWLDKESEEVKGSRNVSSGAISIAVDLNDTAFVLYKDRIDGITASDAKTEYPLTVDGNEYTLGEQAGQILLCFMENGLDDGEESEQNYAIVLDTYRHRVLKADGNALNARFVDYSYESPDIVGSTAAWAPQNRIIRKAKIDTPLFDYPIETKSNYTIVADTYVIMPDYLTVAPSYNPDETPEFALVLVDDKENNRLIQGYVYRDALTDPLPYNAPESEVCTVTGEVGTRVYKLPSINAKAVDGYAETAKGTKFTMLDFVHTEKGYGFMDSYGYYWYRVSIDSNKEGYVLAINVSPIDYYQANILPDYNAEIVAYKGKTTAKTYSQDKSGKYIEISEITLKAGTKVEVVGSFDSSERYTQIKYLDEKSRKTVTCYVETVHIKYTGVNIVFIVAIIVIAITMILAIIILTRVYYNKKKRLNRDEDDSKNTDTD